MSRNDPSVNDYALAWLRIAVGILFLVLASYKVLGHNFVHGGFAASIHLFLHKGAYPFMVPILHGLVLRHAKLLAQLVAYGELGIGLGLLLGVLVRTASFFGLIYMVVLILSAGYPGPHAAIGRYFVASLNCLPLAFCFVAFGMGDAGRTWSVTSSYRRKLRRLAMESIDQPDTSFNSSNVFGK